MSVSGRVTAVSTAVAIGWAANLLLHAMVFSGGSSHDAGAWRMWTAMYAAFAFAIVGLPVAVSGTPPPTAFGKLGLLGAAAGATLTLLPPALFLFPYSQIVGAVAGAASGGFSAPPLR